MTTVSTKDVERAAVKAANQLIGEFRSNPYAYLFESDLQMDLAARLREALPGSLHVPGMRGSSAGYELRLVYTEYLSKIDVACLSPDRVASERFEPYGNWDLYLYEMPVHVGIELKYLKMGDRFDVSECLIDDAKLRRLGVTRHLVLGFVQSDALVQRFWGTKHSAVHRTELDGPQIPDLDAVYVASPTGLWQVRVDA